MVNAFVCCVPHEPTNRPDLAGQPLERSFPVGVLHRSDYLKEPVNIVVKFRDDCGYVAIVVAEPLSSDVVEHGLYRRMLCDFRVVHPEG